MTKKKILLVEDEPMWQEAIRALLLTQDDLDLAGVSDNYDDALTAFDAVNPDIVLLDWKIRGDRDGIDVGRALEAKGMATGRMIVVSGSPEEALPENPYLYVPKQQVASRLLETLQAIGAKGEKIGLPMSSSKD